MKIVFSGSCAPYRQTRNSSRIAAIRSTTCYAAKDCTLRRLSYWGVSYGSKVNAMRF